MKRILLKIAYLINNHYYTTEIKEGNYIKCKGLYFQIQSLSLTRDISCGDELEIKAIGINTYLEKVIIK